MNPTRSQKSRASIHVVHTGVIINLPLPTCDFVCIKSMEHLAGALRSLVGEGEESRRGRTDLGGSFLERGPKSRSGGPDAEDHSDTWLFFKRRPEAAFQRLKGV
ncbi:hypothetical protein H8959_004122 [Pygathrix nigripes]